MNREQDHSAPPALGSGKYCPVFNLFRHKLTPDLLCAVPEDYPVPGFLNASTWSFAGAVGEAAYALAELNWNAAMAGVRLSGFYLFQSCPAPRRVVEACSNETLPHVETAQSYAMHPAEVQPEPITNCLPRRLLASV